MAKKIRFALKMKDGVEARNLQELQEHFDIDSVMEYYLNGKLETWLDDRYYDEEANQVRELAPESSELSKKLCEIFQVEYVRDALTPEEIEARNRKIERLREITDDEEIIAKVDSVAFSQEELADLLDEGLDTIYLCGENFRIPLGRPNITYVGIQTKLGITKDQLIKYENKQIHFIDLVDNAEENVDVEEESKVDDNQVVLLCEKHFLKRDAEKNFLVHTVRDIQPYEYGCEEDDDDDEEEIEIEYYSIPKKISTPEISEYKACKHNGHRILYLGETGTGTIFASMSIDGQNNRILRSWDVNDGEYLDEKNYILGEDYLLTAYRKEDDEYGWEYFVERISSNGECVQIDNTGNLNINKCIGTKQGFFELNYDYEYGMGELVVNSIKHSEHAVDTYKVKIRNEEAGKILNTYVDGDLIYFFLYRYELGGLFYCFDTISRKVRLVSKKELDGESITFCVQGRNIIYYMVEDEWSYFKRMDIISGNEYDLWPDMKEVPVKEIKLVGDYVYILPGFRTRGNRVMMTHSNYSYVYRVKTDGTEKTLVGYEKHYLSKFKNDPLYSELNNIDSFA